MPDKMTAVLAEIRSANEVFGEGAADVPRLLAAVEAVLERHVPKTRTVRHICPAHGVSEHLRNLPYPEERAILDACPDCRKVSVTACAACDPVCPDDNHWPCEDVQAISRALLGKDGT